LNNDLFSDMKVFIHKRIGLIKTNGIKRREFLNQSEGPKEWHS
jgi:hypothetical protein